MSFQDRTQHQIGQIDKEVCVACIRFYPTPTRVPVTRIGISESRCIVNFAIRDFADVNAGQLSKYPALNRFEKQTSVPKVYAFLGLVGIYFFLIFFNIAGEFLVNFAGFLIPGYYSLDALFSASKVDDTQVSFCVPPFN